jgi:fucose 4-O-acetylase-like acetyltransferase
MQKRLNYVDMIKGLCILVVVFYHLTAPCGLKTVLDHLSVSALIAFFFISGFFHRPGKRTLGENLWSRFKALMIPFFQYSLFFWAVGTIVLVSTGKETLIEGLLCLRNFFAGCIWNRTIQNWFGWEYYSLGKRYMFLADFWFLLALMLASIVFLLIIDHVIKSKAKTLVMAGVLFAVTGVLRAFAIDLPYNIQLVPFWAGLLVLGAFAGNYNLFDISKFSAAHESLSGRMASSPAIPTTSATPPRARTRASTTARSRIRTQQPSSGTPAAQTSRRTT